MTLATISLIVAIIASGIGSLGFIMLRAWGPCSQGLDCYTSILPMVLGPTTLVLYVAFLKTKKDSFFYPIVATFIIILAMFVYSTLVN